MLKFVILTLILIDLSLITVSKRTSTVSRFSPLSLFNVVSWPNEECEVNENGQFTNGTCYAKSECRQYGGEAKGECANGFGVCCIFKYSCGNTSNENISYFLNPNFPNHFNEPSSCTMKVKKVNDQICQIRLDFEEFTLLGPTEYGPNVNLKQTGSSFGSINSESNCKDDLFVVTQSNRNQPIPIICGKNNGHHIYIPVEESDSQTISVTFLTGIKEFARKWKIKITQLSCSVSQEILAPQGCLQYYSTPKGLIKTFNYEGKRYLQNIDYSICIRKPKNMCYLTFTTAKFPPPVTSTTPSSTSGTNEPIHTDYPIITEEIPLASAIDEIRIPEPIPIPIFQFLNNTMALRGRSRFAGDEFCIHDGYWIRWPGSNRICSNDIESLESSVTISTNAPEVLHFHSLTWTQAMAFNVNNLVNPKGFALNYAHAPCTHGFL